MKLLDRYIAKNVIGTTAFVALVLIGIQSFLELIQQFRHIGVAQYGVWEAILYVPLQLPAQFYQLFPMAGFLGCMIGLGRLATSSQLIVMRASGISIKRIAFSVVKAAVPMIVVVTFLGEGVGPVWQQYANMMRQNALHPQNSKTRLQSVWIREKNIFTHISHISGDNTIAGVTRYYFDQNDRLLKAVYAKTGRMIKDGRWVLFDLTKTIFDGHHTQVEKQKQEKVNLLLRPNLQAQIATNPAEQSLMDLYHAIQYRRSIGLSANQLIYSFWQRMLQPVASLIMICLGVPFVFGSLRSSSMGMKVLTGVVIGFIFYMLNQLFGPITLVYQYPPILAAITPPAVFMIVFFILLMRTR